MAGATPRQAVENFVRPLQEALACLTTSRIDRQGQYDLAVVYVLTLNGGEAVRVGRASAPGFVGLRISQQYRIIEARGDAGPYKVQTAGYMYSVENEAGQEFFGYHWHPRGPSGHTQPHLHLEGAAHVGHAEVQRAHFPTGRISVEEFLRLAVEVFRLRTRRTDWRSTLNRTLATFKKWQTWA